jgi:hypothetical protein
MLIKTRRANVMSFLLLSFYPLPAGFIDGMGKIVFDWVGLNSVPPKAARGISPLTAFGFLIRS